MNSDNKTPTPLTDANYIIPATLEGMIAMLQRRIEVHEQWANWIRDCPNEAQAAVDSGVGTEKSHMLYAKQYIQAICLIEHALSRINDLERQLAEYKASQESEGA